MSPGGFLFVGALLHSVTWDTSVSAARNCKVCSYIASNKHAKLAIVDLLVSMPKSSDGYYDDFFKPDGTLKTCEEKKDYVTMDCREDTYCFTAVGTFTGHNVTQTQKANSAMGVIRDCGNPALDEFFTLNEAHYPEFGKRTSCYDSDPCNRRRSRIDDKYFSFEGKVCTCLTDDCNNSTESYSDWLNQKCPGGLKPPEVQKPSPTQGPGETQGPDPPGGSLGSAVGARGGTPPITGRYHEHLVIILLSTSLLRLGCSLAL